MKTAYFKDSVRKLKSSIFQYISIILIIVLGVAFFVGMNVIAPNMGVTAEKYLKDNKVYDINLISTIGFDEKDLEEVKKTANLKLAEGMYTQDVLVDFDEDTTLPTRLTSISKEELNKTDLVDGRMPEKDTECVIDTRMRSMYGFNIGDKIQVKSGTDEKIEDLVNVTEFEVVGVGRNPMYLSQYYGTTLLGTGELKSYMMVDKSIFKSDIYTTLFLRAENSENYNYFEDEDAYKEEMEKVGNEALDKVIPNIQERCDNLYVEQKKKIQDAEVELTNSENKYKDAKKQLEDAENQLKEQEEIWLEVKKQYQVNVILNPMSVSGVSLEQINQMLSSIENAKKELETQKSEFDSKKDEYEKEIEDNKEKLEDAKLLLENFSVDLYQNNLTKNESFISLKNDLVKIGMMGKVFPVMFFIVAALVTITTVTRTIEEERGNIGILKALGYGNFTIAKKFIIYSILTTIIGTGLGMLVGNTVILNILYDSYSSLYALPSLKAEINWPYTLLVIGISMISIIGVTVFITLKALKEKASELMRPKSAKEGKNIGLEKVGFLWKHFNFFYKSSFRNIFRYKRRLFMGIVGIAGCTALIYTGFALKSSIDKIAIRQFSEVRTYDMELNLKTEFPENKLKDVEEYIKGLDGIDKLTPVRQQSTTLWFKDKSKDLYYIAIDKNEIKNYINLKERVSGKEIKLSKKGIVVTEKLAKTFGIKVGDKVKLGDEAEAKEVKVIGITENYLYNYIYITPELYKEVYDTEIKYNQFFANTEDLDQDEIEDLTEDIKENEKVAGIMLTSMVNEEYKKSLNSLSSIVWLCIGCASILAFVVLVNLNIINISERNRELATLKVLGFYEKEVSSYVFRENVILSILGVFFGMLLGTGALGIIIQSAEVETIMLPNELNVQSFAYAAILTIVFTFITNFVMNPKIKKIDMIDSLKSVE